MKEQSNTLSALPVELPGIVAGAGLEPATRSINEGRVFYTIHAKFEDNFKEAFFKNARKIFPGEQAHTVRVRLTDDETVCFTTRKIVV